jgi:hypothetical protein
MLKAKQILRRALSAIIAVARLGSAAGAARACEASVALRAGLAQLGGL